MRYGALIGGIGYGILHRGTLQRRKDGHVASKEAEKQEKWIAEANEAWEKKQKSGSGLGAFGIDHDPSDAHSRLGIQ